VAQFAGSHLTLPKVTIRHGRGEESAPVEESRDNREHPKEQRIKTTTKQQQQRATAAPVMPKKSNQWLRT